MKEFWKQKILPNLFYINTASILLPLYIHVPVLLLSVLYLIWTKRAAILDTFTEQKWLSVFIVYVMIVSLLNRNYIGALIPFVYFLFTIFFTHYIRWLNSERYLKLLNILSLGSIFVALVAFYDYISYVLTHGYTLLYVFQYANVQTRAEGTFFNANYYGLFCIFAIVMTLYLLLNNKYRQKFFWIYLLSLIFNFTGILLTASRMLLPTLAVVVVWFVFWTKKNYFIGILALVLAGTIIVVINPEILPRLTSIEYAFQDRFALWNVGWQIFRSSPIFGRGAMSYLNLYYLYTDKADLHAHQLLINLLANYGVTGVIILGFVIKDYAKRLIELMKQRSLRREFALVSSIIAAVLVHGLVDVSIFWVQTGYIFLLICLIPTEILKQLPAEEGGN